MTIITNDVTQSFNMNFKRNSVTREKKRKRNRKKRFRSFSSTITHLQLH